MITQQPIVLLHTTAKKGLWDNPNRELLSKKETLNQSVSKNVQGNIRSSLNTSNPDKAMVSRGKQEHEWKHIFRIDR